ncbi:aromatic-ring-hydroxylating dioxygenase subunit beta [Neobacillus kokaensis]|nr:aromatic-ring-hydroxylating dioxygenase subunit beta [Neobacillus kokaensis]
MVESHVREETSRYSYYMDLNYYINLAQKIKAWGEETIKADRETVFEIKQFLYREARLLDEGKMEDWLQLFTKDCLYWTPVTPGGGDPTKEITISFDDRRRLEDRVYRLRTGYAWSQIPASRTIRSISNVEVWKENNSNLYRVRCNFMLNELRAGKMKLLSGWYGFLLTKENNDWKILVKQNNLLDSDQAHENLTLLL